MSVWWVPQSKVACSGQASSTERVGIRLGQEGWAILRKAKMVGIGWRGLSGQREQQKQQQGGRRVLTTKGNSKSSAPMPLEIKPADKEPAGGAGKEGSDKEKMLCPH